jgi:hypothetical protein
MSVLKMRRAVTRALVHDALAIGHDAAADISVIARRELWRCDACQTVAETAGLRLWFVDIV